MNVSTPVPGGKPWRVVLFDPDPADPKLMLLMVAVPGDVEPLALAGEEAVADWVAARTGWPVSLTRIRGVRAWLVDEGEPR